MDRKIDFERVITDPVYRRQVVARLNGEAQKADEKRPGGASSVADPETSLWPLSRTR